MAARLRLTRTGRLNSPSYRLGVYDSRTRREGRPVEFLGTYNPFATSADQKFNFKSERIQYWLSVGAQPTESVNAFLSQLGIEKPAKKKRQSKKLYRQRRRARQGRKAQSA